MNKGTKIVVTIAACFAMSGTVYAALAPYSIFDGENNSGRKSAKAVKMETPASAQNLKYEIYDGYKIPVAELEPLLAEAEAAANAVIDEHNLRVDIMAMKDEYDENSEMEKIATDAEALLKAADVCNANQMRLVYSCGTDERRPATINGKEHCNSIWAQGFKPLLIGQNTDALNNAKWEKGIWWGGAFDPVLTQSLFTATTSEIATSNIPDEVKGSWKSLVNSSAGKTGDTSAKVYPLAVESSEDSSSQSDGSDIAQMKQYNKAKWLIGYNLLTDIYHNATYGVPKKDTRRSLWTDQKTRYQKEIIENFFRYHESHYSELSKEFAEDKKDPKPLVKRIKIADTEVVKNEPEREWDSLDGSWQDRIKDYQKAWADEHWANVTHYGYPNEEYRTCCNMEKCAVEDGETFTCCEYNPEDYKLVRELVSLDHDGALKIRNDGTCSNELKAGADLTDNIQQPPLPLILNNGSPSVRESVFIDLTCDGDKCYYELDTEHIPDVWDKTTFNKTEGYIGPKTAKEEILKQDDFLNNGEYNEFASAVGKLRKDSAFPFNQNRISAYLDIYEEYVLANNANAKAKFLNGQLNTSLCHIMAQFDEKLDCDNPNNKTNYFDKIDNIYEGSIKRQRSHFVRALEKLDEISDKINIEKNREYYNEYKEAVEDMSSDKNAKNDNPEGAGPRIPSDPSNSPFLYRLGRVYQTLAYFGTSANNMNDTSTKITGENDYVERINADGSFLQPKQFDGKAWPTEGDRIVLPRAGVTKTKINGSSSHVKGEYINVGPNAKLSDEIDGKNLSYIKESGLVNLNNLFKNQRKDRYKNTDLLETSKVNAEKFKGDTKSLGNFDTETCMFKKFK